MHPAPDDRGGGRRTLSAAPRRAIAVRLAVRPAVRLAVRLAPALAAAVALAACTTREPAPPATLAISRPYYVLPAGTSPAAIYLTMTNRSATADTLTAIESEAGAMVMLHGPMPAMETIGAITIAPGTTERLAPGGRHGMVAAPRAGIQRGDSVTVTLRFAWARAIVVRAAAIGYADVDTATAPRE